METEQTVDEIRLIGIGLADEIGVLPDAFPGDGFAVAVGGLIAQAGADAQLFGRLGDGREAARDGWGLA